MDSLLTGLLNNSNGLSKSAAAQLIRQNATQLLGSLIKGGLDTESAKGLVQYFTSTLLTSKSPVELSHKETVLNNLVQHFKELPTVHTPTQIRDFKQGLNALLKQMLHILTSTKGSDTPSPLHTYAQNQLFRHTELSATLSGSLQDSDAAGEIKEKREQQLFGLAEEKNTGKRNGSDQGKEKKRESTAELIQLLLSLKQSFKNMLQALLTFQKQYEEDEAIKRLPDLHERIHYLKERLQECDAVLKRLY